MRIEMVDDPLSDHFALVKIAGSEPNGMRPVIWKISSEINLTLLLENNLLMSHKRISKINKAGGFNVKSLSWKNKELYFLC